MADDRDKLEIEITVDNKGAKRGLDETAASGARLKDLLGKDLAAEGGAGLGQIAEVINTRVLVALGAVGAAVAAVKFALNLTLEAEKVQQIDRSFNALASSARLAGDEIREGLIDASRGLADDDDILQAANRGIVTLGSNAARLPEIMDLARKATALFGGELVQNFEKLNDALGRGNARALQQFGIQVDSDAAIKKYAASIGYSAAVLTDHGRKQAIFNAGLEATKAKLADVDETSNQATNTLQQLKVSIQQLSEAVAVSSQQSGFFAGILGFLKDSVEGYAGLIRGKFGSAQDQLTFKINSTASSMVDLEANIRHLKASLEGSAGLDRANILTSINTAQAELNERRREYLALQNQIDSVQQKDAPKAAGTKAAPTGSDGADPNVDRVKQAELVNQFQQTLLQIRNARVQSDQELLALGRTSGDAAAQVHILNAERTALINAQYDQQERALKAKYKADELNDSTGLANALVNINQERANKINAIHQQESDQISALQAKQIENNPAAGFDEIVASFRIQSDQMKNIAAQAASALRNSFVTGFSSAFAAMGNAFATGKNGLQEFGKSVLQTLGTLCQQLGQMFILIGAAMTGTGELLGLSGGPAIAAGIGLSILGGVLGGLAGGSSSVSSASGGTASPTISTDLPELDRNQRQTAVTINIQGNVLDRRETGMEITEILNEYFSANDGRLVVAS